MTTRLPVVGSTAATTAFCHERLDGPGDLHLFLDGNGKITASNGTLAAPRPNALSLRNVDDCPQRTPTCERACLASFHKVLTADLRYVRLKELPVGDRLISFDENLGALDAREAGKRGRRRFRTGVVRAIRHETRSVSHVTLSSGKQFWATPDHLWLLSSTTGGNLSWRRTDELTRLGKSKSVPRYLDQWETAASFEAGWLAGLYDGEGCLYKAGGNWSLTLSQKEGPVLERARRAIQAVLGEDTFTHCAQARDVGQLRLKGGRYQALKALGALRPTRLLAKFTPDDIGELLATEYEQIVSVEPGGETEVTLIDVDAGTMIVEGYAHHNCYVENLRAAQPDLYALYEHNAATIRTILADPALAADWAVRLGAWIVWNAAGGFRFHVSGDVLSMEHARWIADVCRACSPVVCWIYTRSFDFLEPLVQVSTQLRGNLALNLSCDADNYAAAVAASRRYFYVPDEDDLRLRLCYLTTDGALPDDLPPGSVVFPDYQLRPRAYSTLAASPWWQTLTPDQRAMCCPVDAHGKSEKRRCGIPGGPGCSRCTL